MDFKNSITLTSNKMKFIMPLEHIVNIFQVPNNSYSSNPESFKTCIAIRYEMLHQLGLVAVLNRYNEVNVTQGLFLLEVEEEFKELTTILKGGKGADILFKK